jgi:hypothetical protein
VATIFDATARSALEARVRRLLPDSPRQWGRMSPHQAICHLSDAFKVAVGERPCAPVAGRFKQLVKLVALYAPVHWPRGTIVTVPEAEQGRGGTPPVEFERDRAELLALMERFATTGAHALPPTHPIFDRMTATDWGRWGYRHVDHHLRQFGE